MCSPDLLSAETDFSSQGKAASAGTQPRATGHAGSAKPELAH
jgi:hypothetical protein